MFLLRGLMTIDESVRMIMKGQVVDCAAFGHMYHKVRV